jgi:hypothetical protein
MGNQTGGPNRKPRRGGQRGFWLRVWGLWSSPPSQYCNNDPAISFQKFWGNAARHASKAGVALQISDSLPLTLHLGPYANHLNITAAPRGPPRW